MSRSLPQPTLLQFALTRGLDLLYVLDLTPLGRGDWYASFDYPAKVTPGSR